MSTIIYLSNQQIQVLTGQRGSKKVSVKDCFMATAPDGSIINGMIMDTELFVGFLKELWSQKGLPAKDVYLVVNTTKFVGQTIELPVMNDEKTLDYVEREFAELDRGEERIHGYIRLASPDKKLQRIYAESITPDFLNDYVEIFNEAGIKVKGITSGESSIIGLTGATVGRQYKTFILQIADKMTLSTILWVNGTFYYYNSVRCFHEQGTEDYAIDMARSISQIIQFMQAHQIEYTLEQVVLAGIDGKDLELYQEVVRQQGIQTPLSMFGKTQGITASDECDVQGFLYAASGLFLNGKMQNFMERISQKKKRGEGEGSSRVGFIMIGVVLVIMVTGVIICALVRMAKQQELQLLKDYNENPATMMQAAEYDSLVERNDFLAAQYKSIAGLTKNLETYPWCSDGIVEQIEQLAQGYATISIDSFNADTGQVSMVATSEEVELINAFINILAQQEIFYDVDYTGYSYDSGNEMWNIHVICILSESVGR